MRSYQKPKTPVLTDPDGWADANQFKPQPYDLVELKDKFNKRSHGWWTGNSWDYGKKHLKSDIYKWRKIANKEGEAC